MSSNFDPAHWGIVVAILCLAVFGVARAVKGAKKQPARATVIQEQAASSVSSISGFRNPANGYVEAISLPFLWCLFFGCFYLAYKGAWLAAGLALVLAFVTGGLSWLVFPFFARQLVRKSYLQRGWVEVGTT